MEWRNQATTLTSSDRHPPAVRSTKRKADNTKAGKKQRPCARFGNRTCGRNGRIDRKIVDREPVVIPARVRIDPAESKARSRCNGESRQSRSDRPGVGIAIECCIARCPVRARSILPRQSYRHCHRSNCPCPPHRHRRRRHRCPVRQSGNRREARCLSPSIPAYRNSAHNSQTSAQTETVARYPQHARPPTSSRTWLPQSRTNNHDKNPLEKAEVFRRRSASGAWPSAMRNRQGRSRSRASPMTGARERHRPAMLL